MHRRARCRARQNEVSRERARERYGRLAEEHQAAIGSEEYHESRKARRSRVWCIIMHSSQLVCCCFLHHAFSLVAILLYFMSVKHAESLDHVDTVYSACSISTCPPERSLFACGLYQIVKDESAETNEESPATKRLGRCLLNRMNDQGKMYWLCLSIDLFCQILTSR